MEQMDATARMDRKYCYQRYVYDLSRKYYLFGRDTLLNDIVLQADENLLELGCGTARNLTKLAYRYPIAQFFGVDASALMLDMARKNLQKVHYGNSIQLKQGLAEQISWRDLNLTEPFDHILFSYVLSMLPDWERALEHALTLLKPQGCLHIVDFSDQATMPSYLRKSLLTWLDWFDVHPHPSMLQKLTTLAQAQHADLCVQQLPYRYAFLVHFRKRDAAQKTYLPTTTPYLTHCLDF